MAKQQPPTKLSPARATRDGEGWPLHVTFGEGTGSRAGQPVMTADFAAAPVPSKRYVADIVHVSFAYETVHLLFGQQRVSLQGGLRNLLIIHMSPVSVARLLELTDDIRKPSIQEIETRMAMDAVPQSPIHEEPKDTVALSATFGMVAISGREACLDFYSASPFALSMAPRSHQLAVDPVVRVDLRTPLLLSMIKQVRDVMARMPAELHKSGVENV